MIETKIINLEEYAKYDQFHDESIDNVSFSSENLILTINKPLTDVYGHFEQIKIIFSDFDDIKYDVELTISKLQCRNGGIHISGEKYDLDNLVKFVNEYENKLEIVDFMYGFKKVNITGQVISSTNKRNRVQFVLEISAKHLKYEFKHNRFTDYTHANK